MGENLRKRLILCNRKKLQKHLCLCSLGSWDKNWELNWLIIPRLNYTSSEMELNRSKTIMTIKQAVPRVTDDRMKHVCWGDDQKRHSDPWGCKGSALYGDECSGLPSLPHREPRALVCPLSPSGSLSHNEDTKLPLPVPAWCCPEQCPITRSSLFSFWSSIQPLALWRAILWMLVQKPSSKVGSEGEFPCGYRRRDPMASALIPGDPASSVAPPLDYCCHSQPWPIFWCPWFHTYLHTLQSP